MFNKEWTNLMTRFESNHFLSLTDVYWFKLFFPISRYPIMSVLLFNFILHTSVIKFILSKMSMSLLINVISDQCHFKNNEF